MGRISSDEYNARQMREAMEAQQRAAQERRQGQLYNVNISALQQSALQQAAWTTPAGTQIVFDERGGIAGIPTSKVKKPVPSTTVKKPVITFDSVILEDEKKQQIIEALEQINQAHLIFNVWGFGETIEKGKGVSLLFYGPPGTGKTLMAQAIGKRLKQDVAIISTADIESSAPGEAERNIRKYFREAGEKKQILLFDECDSLIYSRANVGAILGAQVNELLSQLERFDGVTIFTTNRLGNLDEAVNRRLALKLEFPMPDREQRAAIWKRMIPAPAPLADDVDFQKLAGVELTGGYIKNAVLRAARMAATEKIDGRRKKRIHMRHFVKALSHEAKSMMAFENARAEEQKKFGRVTVNSVDVDSDRNRLVKESIDTIAGASHG